MNAPDKISSPFERLNAINVNGHVEKKAGLSYLSWAWAVSELLKADPNATWAYGEPKQYGDTLMVFCSVNAFGKVMTAQLPVMDHRNKAIPNPDAFQVNTAMQRALAKAIALHGLGLYIYAGEDLPEAAEQATTNEDDEVLAKYQEAALLGISSLKAFHSITKGPVARRVWEKHGNELKATANEVSA